jgi:hypothetical protein
METTLMAAGVVTEFPDVARAVCGGELAFPAVDAFEVADIATKMARMTKSSMKGIHSEILSSQRDGALYLTRIREGEGLKIRARVGSVLSTAVPIITASHAINIRAHCKAVVYSGLNRSENPTSSVLVSDTTVNQGCARLVDAELPPWQEISSQRHLGQL